MRYPGQTDKELIRAAFAALDKHIVHTDFADDWNAAAGLCARGQRARMIRPARLRELLLTWPRAAVAISITVLAIITFVDLAGTAEGPAETAAASTGTAITPLDPNLYWYAPTDELLQVGVRQYETQLVTFVIYDPLTMEIK